MNANTEEKIFGGIDGGAAELVLVLRTGNKSQPAQSLPKTGVGHAKLVKVFLKLPGCIVCLEATGVLFVGQSCGYRMGFHPLWLAIQPILFFCCLYSLRRGLETTSKSNISLLKIALTM